MHFRKSERINRWMRCVSALMAAVMLLGACANAEVLEWLFGGDESDVPASAASPTPAPVTEVKASAIEDDGIIRVYLKSLGDPQQLNLTLAGSYAVEGDAGFYFDRNARLALSAVDGDVYLSVSGLTINMGKTLTLTRHAAEAGAENGVYIDESEKDALYCGDLSITASGSELKPVIALDIEEYLYGVVAYEMSDSFPIEALKAQAVAARTYAMQRKWSAGKKAYDLVDTTADQVYKGYIAKYENVIEAVDATRGVVGVYDGGFATCYYTASNGGQTALASHIWGGTGADGYLGMTEDPYDLENPSSLENTLTISRTCEGSAKLRAMLDEALAEAMRSQGLVDGMWRFVSIEKIEPAMPRYEGSLMCDELAFTLNVEVTRPAPEALPTEAPLPTQQPDGVQQAFAAFSAPQPTVELPDISLAQTVTAVESVTVSLAVYDDIKDGLSLGLNGSDYELVAVETAPESFTIIMRRFGHGVGMSQRGAQWMAGQYAKNWMEILNFYYPGMSVERIEWPERSLTPVAELPSNVGAARPLPTPTPTPAPLPALEEGEYYAQVALETKSSTLNVRKGPGTNTQVVDKLDHARRVIVCTAPDAEGWVAIRTAEIEGYVKIEYLKPE